MKQDFVVPLSREKTRLKNRIKHSPQSKVEKLRRRRNLMLLLPDYFDMRAAVGLTELLNISGATIAKDIKWLYEEGHLEKPNRGYYKKVSSATAF